MPAPVLATLPPPLMTLPTVTAVGWLKVSVPLSTMMPPVRPEVALPKVSELAPPVKWIAAAWTPPPDTPPAIVPDVMIVRFEPTIPSPPAP